MVLSTMSTTEDLTNNIPMKVGKLGMNKKPSSRNSLRHFSVIFYVKQKNDVQYLGDSKTKHKEIRRGTSL